MRVAQAIAEILKREGVEFVVGYPVNPIFEAAAEPKTFHAIEGAYHNDWYLRDPETYFGVWRTFLDALPAEPPSRETQMPAMVEDS